MTRTIFWRNVWNPLLLDQSNNSATRPWRRKFKPEKVYLYVVHQDDPPRLFAAASACVLSKTEERKVREEKKHQDLTNKLQFIKSPNAHIKEHNTIKQTHTHTHTQTQTHASTHIYIQWQQLRSSARSACLESAECAGRKAIVYFLVVRTDLAACREFKAGRTGERVTGIWRRSGRCSVDSEILFHEKYENVYLFFLFFYLGF